MVVYAIAVGENIYFSSDLYKFVENGKIEKGTSLKSIVKSLDACDYHVSKCGENEFTELDYDQIHTYYTDEDEDEKEDNAITDPPMIMDYHNGNNEIVKILNQNCVIFLDNPSIYAFRLCGHQCNCELSYQNEGDIDLLKCVICFT